MSVNHLITRRYIIEIRLTIWIMVVTVFSAIRVLGQKELYVPIRGTEFSVKRPDGLPVVTASKWGFIAVDTSWVMAFANSPLTIRQIRKLNPASATSPVFEVVKIERRTVDDLEFTLLLGYKRDSIGERREILHSVVVSNGSVSLVGSAQSRIYKPADMAVLDSFLMSVRLTSKLPAEKFRLSGEFKKFNGSDVSVFVPIDFSTVARHPGFADYNTGAFVAYGLLARKYKTIFAAFTEEELVKSKFYVFERCETQIGGRRALFLEGETMESDTLYHKQMLVFHLKRRKFACVVAMCPIERFDLFPLMEQILLSVDVQGKRKR